jgi:hypothetical protein
MTPEEFETAFCKGKRTAMEFISMWLKEHSEIAESEMETLDPDIVLKSIVASMKILARCLDDRLKSGVNLISSISKHS